MISSFTTHIETAICYSKLKILLQRKKALNFLNSGITYGKHSDKQRAAIAENLNLSQVLIPL